MIRLSLSPWQFPSKWCTLSGPTEHRESHGEAACVFVCLALLSLFASRVLWVFLYLYTAALWAVPGLPGDLASVALIRWRRKEESRSRTAGRTVDHPGWDGTGD